MCAMVILGYLYNIMGNSADSNTWRNLVKQAKRVGQMEHPALGAITILEWSGTMYGLKSVPFLANSPQSPKSSFANPE